MRLLLAAIFLLRTISPGHACSDSQIMRPTPFMGNNGEIFVLADGSVWEVKYEYEYLYEYSPSVVICPERNLLIVAGKKLDVERVGGEPAGASSAGASSFIESRVDGEWEGWQGDSIVKLLNGQLWEQVGARISAKYKYNPRVFVYKQGSTHFMQIDGESSAVQVRRIK